MLSLPGSSPACICLSGLAPGLAPGLAFSATGVAPDFGMSPAVAIAM